MVQFFDTQCSLVLIFSFKKVTASGKRFSFALLIWCFCGLSLKVVVREAALYGLGEVYVAYSHRSGVTWIANQCLHTYFSHAVEDRFVLTVDS